MQEKTETASERCHKLTGIKFSSAIKQQLLLSNGSLNYSFIWLVVLLFNQSENKSSVWARVIVLRQNKSLAAHRWGQEWDRDLSGWVWLLFSIWTGPFFTSYLVSAPPSPHRNPAILHQLQCGANQSLSAGMTHTLYICMFIYLCMFQIKKKNTNKPEEDSSVIRHTSR